MTTTKTASADQTGISLSDVESALRTIMTDVLGDEAPQEIGLDDDFLDIGGTSLSLISVVAKLSERLGAELPTAIIVNGATIREMAKSALAELATAKA
jgi:acyl carrier protein